jgi:hypothetical protein
MHTGLQRGNLKERELMNGQMTWTRCICIFDVCVTVHRDKFSFNPFVTSGTYISHLQRVFSSPMG